MASTDFIVPRLVEEGAWLDWRGDYNNGFTGFGSRSLDEIRFFAPHHSVTQRTGDARRDVNTLFNIHANNGWNMIGYNFVITSEEVNGFAKVAYVGDLATVRAHTPNAKGALGMAAGLGNRYIVAACIIGMNHLEMPTEAQLRSMKLLAQEHLWFEDDRMPNLWNTWDDFQPHYVWDWTQCNGMPHIRQAIIDVYIPPVANDPIPEPQPSWEPMLTPRMMRTKQALRVINLDDFSETGDVLPQGREIDFATKKTVGGVTYLRSRWATDNNKNWGIDQNMLEEIPMAEEPIEEKPVIRALGAIKRVYVGNGDRVVDVITGAVTREYKTDDEFEATHVIEYKGDRYYMTTYSYLQHLEKGKNPAGIDIDTVDEEKVEIIVPEKPAEPQIPPHEGEKPPMDDELKKEHDAILERLNQHESRLSAIDAAVKKLTDYIANLFKGF